MTRRLFYTVTRGVYWQRSIRYGRGKGRMLGTAVGKKTALVFDACYAPRAAIVPNDDVVTNTVACL